MECSDCGNIRESSSVLRCRKCGAVFQSPPLKGRDLNGSDTRDETLWGQSSDNSVVKSFLKSSFEIIVKPGKFFASVKKDNDLFYPLLFALLWSSIGSLMRLYWYLPAANGSAPSFMMPEFTTNFPLLSIISVFVISIYGVIFLNIGSGNTGFESVFKSACYANAASLLMLIPFAGLIASPLLYLYIFVSGNSTLSNQKRIHVLLKLILPIISVLLLLILLFTAIVLVQELTQGKEILELFR